MRFERMKFECSSRSWKHLITEFNFPTSIGTFQLKWKLSNFRLYNYSVFPTAISNYLYPKNDSEIHGLSPVSVGRSGPDFGPKLVCPSFIPFSVENISNAELVPKMSLLNPHGPFCCLNPLPPVLQPGEIHSIAVRFQPSAPTQYHEQFYLQTKVSPSDDVLTDDVISDDVTSDSRLSLTLRGSGLHAKCEITTAEVDFEVTKVNLEVVKEVKLVNHGDFEAKFTLSQVFN